MVMNSGIANIAVIIIPDKLNVVSGPMS